MITFSRRHALLFRSVLRYSLLDQDPKGDWPLLHCQASARGLMLSAQKGDMAVCLHLGGKQADEVLAFRSTLLTELEARNDQPVTLEQVTPAQGKASWQDRVVPRVCEVELVAPDSVPPLPTIPKRMMPFPDSFRRALTDATLVTASENTRYALNRIQISGKEGRVAATDGKQLLVQSGFPFPWPEEFLMPALPALTRKGLLPDEPLALGRTESHLALRMGPWLFLLGIDTKSRFPNTQNVLPDPRGVTCKLLLDPKDAGLLTDALPRLPAEEPGHLPITLDLNERSFVRARAQASDLITEIELPHSRMEGNPCRLCLDRRYLLRALLLGFLQLEVVKPDQPLMARDRDRTYLWLPLDPKGALPPSGEVQPVVPETNNLPAALPERREIMAAANGTNRPESERPNGNQPVNLETLLTEAEELRATFQEAGGRLSRLIAGLKQFRRHNRVFEQAVHSLRQLNLDR